MAQFSGFFNSEIGDKREYNASEFAEYFSRFLSDGVYSIDNKLGLKVVAELGLNVRVETGYAYIGGYMYRNDTPLSIELEAPDSVLSRIDRIVLRLDIVAREIVVAVKKGEFASKPLPPALVDTNVVKELSLAQVKIVPNAQTVIVTDERLTQYCGMVKLLVDVPLDDMYAEWTQWKQDNAQDFNQWQATQKDDYQAWLTSLEQLLDENVAGNLQGLIQVNTDAIGVNEAGLVDVNLEIEKKMDKSKITISSQDADINQMAEGDIWIKYE